MLDLFGAEHAAPKAGAAGAVHSSSLEQNVPLAQADIAPVAIETIATAALAEPAVFRHPRASREVALAGRLVAYEVRRRKRRTIGFSVGAEGLTVSAPKWVPLYELDQAVQRKSAWILKKLHETRERHQRHASARIDWRDGATFPYLGEPLQLVLDGQLAPGLLAPEAGGAGGVGLGTSAGPRRLRLGLAPDAAPAQIQQAVQAWLMAQARQLFTLRLEHFSAQLNVQWRKLSLSSAATRWGSASSSGAIRLNWRLLHFSPAVIDYVVVHELSHLRFMDHSPRFWATVHSVLPGHAAMRRQLKEEVVPRW